MFLSKHIMLINCCFDRHAPTSITLIISFVLFGQLSGLLSTAAVGPEICGSAAMSGERWVGAVVVPIRNGEKGLEVLVGQNPVVDLVKSTCFDPDSSGITPSPPLTVGPVPHPHTLS